MYIVHQLLLITVERTPVQVHSLTALITYLLEHLVTTWLTRTQRVTCLWPVSLVTYYTWYCSLIVGWTLPKHCQASGRDTAVSLLVELYPNIVKQVAG